MRLLIFVLIPIVFGCSAASDEITIELSSGQYDRIEDILAVDTLENAKTVEQAIEVLQKSFTPEFQDKLKLLKGYYDIPFGLEENGIDYGLQAMNYVEDKWQLGEPGCDLCSEMTSRLLYVGYYKSTYLLNRLRLKLLGLSDSAIVSSRAAYDYLDRNAPEYAPKDCLGDFINVESVHLYWNNEMVRSLWLGDCVNDDGVAVKSYLWGVGWFDLTGNFSCEYEAALEHDSTSLRHKEYIKRYCNVEVYNN